MDSPTSDASPDKAEMGPSFRKISSDTANRTYRRPTHVSQSNSSSSDENNEHERSRNPISQKDSAKEALNDRTRKDEEREMERRRSYDRDADKYSYRESRRHEDKHHRKRDGIRDHARSSRYERSDNFDHKDRSKDREKEHERYTNRREDHRYRGRDDKEYYDDERRGPRRGPDERYGKSEKGKEKSRYRETDEGEIDGVERKKGYERENEKLKRSEPVSSFGQEGRERKTKFSKPADTNSMEERAGSNSKQETQASKERPDPALPVSTFGSQAGVANDLNAAKAAAMKAAEFVNKNIGGGGVAGPLTTEQKKKLLWGNKKNESAGAETVQKWDNQFMDRERQEKFNKLMGVKGNAGPENKSEEEKEGTHQTKSREELEMDLEKQYTAGLRRRDGRTVGLGL